MVRQAEQTAGSNSDPAARPDHPSAYDIRGRLPRLAEWMSDDAMKLMPIWQERRLEAGQVYFDLNDPDRGAFTADGTERPLAETPYVARRDVPEWVWTQLITWRRPVDKSLGETLAAISDPENGAAP